MRPAQLEQPALDTRTVLTAPMSWSDRWFAWRDGLIASRKFQRWAAAFPLTRRLARRRALGLFDLVAGFVYSQILLACVRLRLFDMLAEGPQTLAALSRRLELTEESAQRLLSAAVSLNLLEQRSGGRYGLGTLGAPMVGNTAIAAMVEHHATLYADLTNPVALLRGDKKDAAMAAYWPYATTEPGAAPARLAPERVAEYSALMSASQPLVADEVLSAYDFRKHRCLLDVGGGEGTFLSAVAAQAPDLHMLLFDLPAVAERATARFAERGLSGRTRTFGGSFFDDALPRGADIASLIRVMFDHPDERVLAILKAVRRALPDDGTLLLAEPMAATPGAQAMGDAYFGFYLLAMGHGRPRTPAEVTALLAAAGFGHVRVLRTNLPVQTRVMVARCIAI